MPTRATTVRFPPDLWEALEREAERQDTSVAQVVRDAAIMRLAVLMAPEERERGRPVVPPATAGDVPLPPPDERRMRALRQAGLLADAPEPTFDRLARIAAQVLNAPVALVSLVTAEEHSFKSCVGLPVEWSARGGLPITHSFCTHTVAAQRPLVVGDARDHPLLAGSPAITELDAVSYAGVPLITRDGLVVGTLCVIDNQPRVWSRDQVALLSDLAATVIEHIEARIARGAERAAEPG